MSVDARDDWPQWPVCRLEDIADPGAKGFYVGEGDWPFRGFVVRRNGRIFAYANICPHRRHPLDLLEDRFLVNGGELIRCASHGALFEPDTGFCVVGPCVGKSLMKLEARVDEDGVVEVAAPASLRDAGEIIGRGFDTI